MVVVAALDDDLDGDGIDELLLGEPEVDEVHVISGASARDSGRFHEWKRIRVLRPGGDVRPNQGK